MKKVNTDLIEKIVVNTSFGRLATTNAEFEKKIFPEIKSALTQITGQIPQARPARKSIAGFKLREGTIVGLKVTLRRRKMTQFLDRLISIVIPRIRDFHGISLRNIDKNGHLTFGIKEHSVFPEIIIENVRNSFGLEVTIVLKENTLKEEAIAFYRSLGVPLEKEKVTVK